MPDTLRPRKAAWVGIILGLTLCTFAWAQMPGDLDGDGDVDRDDLDIILAALNEPATGPDDPRDLDGDGMITVRDARKLVLLCTRPRCAVETGITVNIFADRTSGERPLTVRLTPEASSEGSSITGYRWDFDGDGNFDTPFEPRPETKFHTYSSAGVSTVVLEVRDQLGRSATAEETITVRNPSPTVAVDVVPSNGAVPLDVTFIVTASSPNGPITSVVIDPGDGSPPIDLPGPGDAMHTYNSIGQFQATVTATDSAGESTTVTSLDLVVSTGPPGSPTAVASATPDSGGAPLDVSLSPAGSTDPNGSIQLYEWDFEYDGTTFDVDAGTAVEQPVNHTYTDSGLHFAALRVTDDQGLTGLDVVVVSVDFAVTLAVLDDTIDPYVDEMTTVRTTMTAGATVTVLINERSGATARTLFSGERPLGSYDDLWDGRDDAGDIVLDQDYYAFVEYQLNGQTFVEPDEPSGGDFTFVSGTESHQDGATWDPWQDQFWELTFDTTRSNAGASEVTLWVTPYFNTSEITATLRTGDVFGTGQYKAWWAGVTNEGSYIPPRGQRGATDDDYLWSAQAFTLADNAIVVQGGRPEITAPAADPNVYYPTTHRCLFGTGNEVTATLSHDSTVALRIFNMDNNNLLRALEFEAVPAGIQTFEWDGKAESGDWVAPGPYRAEITATSDNGNVSFFRRVLILVSY